MNDGSTARRILELMRTRFGVDHCRIAFDVSERSAEWRLYFLDAPFTYADVCNRTDEHYLSWDNLDEMESYVKSFPVRPIDTLKADLLRITHLFRRHTGKVGSAVRWCRPGTAHDALSGPSMYEIVGPVRPMGAEVLVVADSIKELEEKVLALPAVHANR